MPLCDLEECDGEIQSAIVSCSHGHRYLKRPSGEIIQLSGGPDTVVSEPEPVKGAKLAMPPARKSTPRYMPFGKHKGEPIEDLPTEYLVWLADNLTDKPDLVAEAERQLQMRSGKGVVREPFSG